MTPDKIELIQRISTDAELLFALRNVRLAGPWVPKRGDRWQSPGFCRFDTKTKSNEPAHLVIEARPTQSLTNLTPRDWDFSVDNGDFDFGELWDQAQARFEKIKAIWKPFCWSPRAKLWGAAEVDPRHYTDTLEEAQALADQWAAENGWVLYDGDNKAVTRTKTPTEQIHDLKNGLGAYHTMLMLLMVSLEKNKDLKVSEFEVDIKRLLNAKT